MLDLLARFGVGATVVGLSLWISDNRDARLGGVLSAVPKTSAVSLFVIAYEQGGGFAAEAAVSSLFGIGAVILYIATFAILPRLTQDQAPLVLVLGAGLTVYGTTVAGYLLYFEASLGLAANLGFLVAAYLVAATALTRVREGTTRPSAAGATEMNGPGGAAVRYGLPALVAGTLVVAATVAADLLGPVWGGIASVFPANVTTVLVSGAVLLGPDEAFEQAAGIPDGVAAAGGFVLGLHLLLPIVHWALAGLAGYAVWGLSAWGLASIRDPARTCNLPSGGGGRG